jgi:hypothetical protein
MLRLTMKPLGTCLNVHIHMTAIGCCSLCVVLWLSVFCIAW